MVTRVVIAHFEILVDGLRKFQSGSDGSDVRDVRKVSHAAETEIRKGDGTASTLPSVVVGTDTDSGVESSAHVLVESGQRLELSVARNGTRPRAPPDNQPLGRQRSRRGVAR